MPNVLKAYAFGDKKLKAFIDMVDDLMSGESGVTKLERETSSPPVWGNGFPPLPLHCCVVEHYSRKANPAERLVLQN